mmetsp:Transcript_49752/g.74187  ORF Transcript_49752/g.74187 Transcript_49752/m.74187 type:complete len:254 (-) Transcript_49752:102-863(-)
MTVFPRTLSQEFSSTWASKVQDNATPNAPDEAQLLTVPRAFVSEYVDEDDIERFERAMHNVKKPHNIHTKTAATQLGRLNDFFPFFNKSKLSNDNLKKQIIHFQSDTYKKEFHSSAHQLATMTPQAVVNYFHRLETYSLYKQRINELEQKRKSKQARAAQSDPDRQGRKRSSNNNNNASSKRPRRAAQSDECPIHGPGHTWGECNLNPKSSNYGKKFGSKKQTDKSSSEAQGHMVQHDDKPAAESAINDGKSK